MTLLNVYVVLSLLLLSVSEVVTGSSENDAPDKQTAELLWRKITEALLLLPSENRTDFLVKCSKAWCSREEISINGTFQWSHQPSKEAADRFWQTYKCFKQQDLKICPVDGHFGAWTRWNRCKAKCGGENIVVRIRLCNNPRSAHHGMPCVGPSISEQPCHGKCKRGKKKPNMLEAKKFIGKIEKGFPQLGVACKSGHCDYYQLDEFLDENSKNKYWSSLHCVRFNKACPIDGGWGGWTKWSRCQPACGVGIRWRTRKCNDPLSANDGFSCRGPFHQKKQCVGRRCTKADLLYGHYLSDWSSFGACSVPCGKYGTQIKRRVCLLPGLCKKQLGKTSNSVTIRKPCYSGSCLQDGKWSKWGRYTLCSAHCGKGRKIRLRRCKDPDPSKSVVCLGSALQTSRCTGSCDSEWKTQVKQKSVFKRTDLRDKKSKNASRLPGDRDKDEPVQGDPFSFALDPVLEKTFTGWTPWTLCTKTCSVGYRVRSRKCKEKKLMICRGEIFQQQLCNVHNCPVSGGWSDWMAWSACSTTCSKGVHTRYRRCDNPYPQNGGNCPGLGEEQKPCKNGKCKDILGYSEWQPWGACTKSCGVGTQQRIRKCSVKSSNQKLAVAAMRRGCSELGTVVTDICNPIPCAVNGKWSNWGSWSACSMSCGHGHHYRDRTCTDPSPEYGGSVCSGSGTDKARCFSAPCTESTDLGISLDGTSWLQYNRVHKPSHFFLLYILFRPMKRSGVLLQRYKGCEDTYCKHNVTLQLLKGILHVAIHDHDATLRIKSNVTFTKGVWHSVFIHIHGNEGFLRINDDKRTFGRYSPSLKGDINYDAQMILGWDRRKTAAQAFVGDIALIRVNFNPMSLFPLPGWKNGGVPVKKSNVKPFKLDPTVAFPKFLGRNFLKLPVFNARKLRVSITFFALKMEGLLLFNAGHNPGSYAYMNIHNGLLKFCLKCDKKKACESVETVRPKSWYHVSVYVSGNTAEIRCNNGKAIQLTSPGHFYYPNKPVYVGGGEIPDWIVLRSVTGSKTGFFGVIHDVTINGKLLKLKGKTLMNSVGELNTMGLSYVGRVNEVFEHTKSNVTMRCDYTPFLKFSNDVKVEWFKVDTRLNSSPTQRIIPQVPGIRKVGSLVLSGPNHEGLYACGIKHDGILTLQHAFVVIRHNITIKYKIAEAEEYTVRVLAVLIPLLLLFCISIAVQQRIADVRRLMLNPITKQMARFYKDKKGHGEGQNTTIQGEVTPQQLDDTTEKDDKVQQNDASDVSAEEAIDDEKDNLATDKPGDETQCSAYQDRDETLVAEDETESDSDDQQCREKEDVPVIQLSKRSAAKSCGRPSFQKKQSDLGEMPLHKSSLLANRQRCSLADTDDQETFIKSSMIQRGHSGSLAHHPPSQRECRMSVSNPHPERNPQRYVTSSRDSFTIQHRKSSVLHSPPRLVPHISRQEADHVPESKSSFKGRVFGGAVNQNQASPDGVRVQSSGKLASLPPHKLSSPIRTLPSPVKDVLTDEEEDPREMNNHSSFNTRSPSKVISGRHRQMNDDDALRLGNPQPSLLKPHSHSATSFCVRTPSISQHLTPSPHRPITDDDVTQQRFDSNFNKKSPSKVISGQHRQMADDDAPRLGSPQPTLPKLPIHNTASYVVHTSSIPQHRASSPYNPIAEDDITQHRFDSYFNTKSPSKVISEQHRPMADDDAPRLGSPQPSLPKPPSQSAASFAVRTSSISQHLTPSPHRPLDDDEITQQRFDSYFNTKSPSKSTSGEHRQMTDDDTPSIGSSQPSLPKPPSHIAASYTVRTSSISQHRNSSPHRPISDDDITQQSFDVVIPHPPLPKTPSHSATSFAYRTPSVPQQHDPSNSFPEVLSCQSLSGSPDLPHGKNLMQRNTSLGLAEAKSDAKPVSQNVFDFSIVHRMHNTSEGSVLQNRPPINLPISLSLDLSEEDTSNINLNAVEPVDFDKVSGLEYSSYHINDNDKTDDEGSDVISEITVQDEDSSLSEDNVPLIQWHSPETGNRDKSTDTDVQMCQEQYHVQEKSNITDIAVCDDT